MSRFRCPGCRRLIKGKGVARLCDHCADERAQIIDAKLKSLNDRKQ